MASLEHIKKYEDLITPYEKTRAGFISIALEKNKQATPFIEEARALKVIASKVNTPKMLLTKPEIWQSLLTASGLSDKAISHLGIEDQKVAIEGLIKEYLQPAGAQFAEELVYRFLLTRGDSLGGIMRNIAGKLGEWKFTRALLSTGKVSGKKFSYKDASSDRWLPMDVQPDIERDINGLSWETDSKARTLLYNIKVPIVNKNVDLILFNCKPSEFKTQKKRNSVLYQPDRYLALGELKGGIDPAGADEHWKTANSALNRIRDAFSSKNLSPSTFFIAAAIENAMANELFTQIEKNVLSNCANLTDENQVVSLCKWIIEI